MSRQTRIEIRPYEALADQIERWCEAFLFSNVRFEDIVLWYTFYQNFSPDGSFYETGLIDAEWRKRYAEIVVFVNTFVADVCRHRLGETKQQAIDLNRIEQARAFARELREIKWSIRD